MNASHVKVAVYLQKAQHTSNNNNRYSWWWAETHMLQCRMLICGHHNPCYSIYQRCMFFIADSGQNYNKQIRLMMYLPPTYPLGNTCTGTCTQFAGTNSIFLAVYWACYKINSTQDKRFGHIEWCQSLAFWELMSTVVSKVWKDRGQ